MASRDALACLLIMAQDNALWAEARENVLLPQMAVPDVLRAYIMRQPETPHMEPVDYAIAEMRRKRITWKRFCTIVSLMLEMPTVILSSNEPTREQTNAMHADFKTIADILEIKCELLGMYHLSNKNIQTLPLCGTAAPDVVAFGHYTAQNQATLHLYQLETHGKFIVLCTLLFYACNRYIDKIHHWPPSFLGIVSRLFHADS